MAADAGAPDLIAQLPIAAVQGPRVLADELPFYTQRDIGVVLDEEAARRLATSASTEFGLWLVPARRLEMPDSLLASPGPPKTCLRLVPLSGPDRGGGGISCTLTSSLRDDQRLLVNLSGGKLGVPGVARPRELILAGLVPDGVRRVHLGLRGGGKLSQRVENNGFVVNTTRIVVGISYRTPDGAVRFPVRTCQLCDFGGPAPNR